MKKLISLILTLAMVFSMTAVFAEEEAPAWDPQPALEALIQQVTTPENEGEESNVFLVLSGIGGGWAPTVLVLNNDGTFVALVDYAGQATVNFAMGEWEENDDGSITCEGVQYNTGEDLIYEIAKDEEGFYSVEIEIPDAGTTVVLTDKPAEKAQEAA